MREPEVVEGSGNVFADLEVPGAEEELLKAQLTYEIYAALRELSLTESGVAELLGVQPSQAGKLMRNRPGRLSTGRLMRCLTRLGRDVQITVRPKTSTDTIGQVKLLVQTPEAVHA